MSEPKSPVEAGACDGCNSTAAQRMLEDYTGLRPCNRCGALKCALCDMGDDVECASCFTEDEP